MIRTGNLHEFRTDRTSFVGGSDARIIMGNDESALLRLWREKRGEIEPEDLSGELVVQLGSVTEALNRRWYEKNTGHVLPTCSDRYSIPCTGGWRRPSMAGRSNRRSIRSQVHAAMEFLGGGSRGKTHGAAAAQHVGDSFTDCRALDHHWRRQMGRDQDPLPIRSISIF